MAISRAHKPERRNAASRVGRKGRQCDGLELRDRIRQILADALGAPVFVKNVDPHQPVTSPDIHIVVVSHAFTDMDQESRFDFVWNTVKRALRPGERRHLGAIYPCTPREDTVLCEDAR